MQTGLWTAFEAAAVTGGALCAKGALAPDEVLPEESWTASGLSIDTRTIQAGEMFVALQDTRDGHDYIANAFAAGAAVALVSRAPENTPDGMPLLLVGDTLAGLTKLASAARDRCYGKFIAVTGSAGKTSTKEMLRAALRLSGKVHAADKSFNNHLGVPLTVAALPSDADFGVFEIGMNHAGEITPLSELVRPHVAIVTTVAAAHLEFFNSVEEIAHAKAEIFAGLRVTNNQTGAAILPKDNDFFDLLANSASQRGCENIISFGEQKGSDIRMISYEAQRDGSGRVGIDLFGKEQVVHLGVPGHHQAMNALAVLGAASYVGASVEGAIEALAKMQPVEGRGARHSVQLDGKRFTLIDESYNANPASMTAAIKLLGVQPCAGKRIAIVGEMRELGADAQALHIGLVTELQAAGVDQVYASGAMMEAMFQALPIEMRGAYADKAIDLVDIISNALTDGDVLMAKGSNASQVGALVKAIQTASQPAEEQKDTL